MAKRVIASLFLMPVMICLQVVNGMVFCACEAPEPAGREVFSAGPCGGSACAEPWSVRFSRVADSAAVFEDSRTLPCVRETPSERDVCCYVNRTSLDAIKASVLAGPAGRRVGTERAGVVHGITPSLTRALCAASPGCERYANWQNPYFPLRTHLRYCVLLS